MRLTKAFTKKIMLSLSFALCLFIYFFISPKRSHSKYRPLRNHFPQFFPNGSNYLCQDSHHRCRAMASYIFNVSKIPCLFCPYSCGLCVVCPNNIHSWNTCCTSRDIHINNAESFFYDTPTSKNYLAHVFQRFDDSDRYFLTAGGISISPHHVITVKIYGDPENSKIYLDYNNIKSPLKLTPVHFTENVIKPNDERNTIKTEYLYIITVKETIPDEYIIPLTKILNPDRKNGHSMGMGPSYSLIEVESEIIVKKATKDAREYLMMRICDIDHGSPLLISEDGRFVLQGILIGTGKELQWIHKVINKGS